MPARFLDAANHALEDVFTLQGVTARQQRLSSGKFDWTWRGPNNDIEWAWFLNRLACLSDLWRAYAKTGNIQYHSYMLMTLDDWMTSNPAPRMLSFSPAWRPLEAARRLLYVWLPLLPAWQAD